MWEVVSVFSSKVKDNQSLVNTGKYSLIALGYIVYLSFNKL